MDRALLVAAEPAARRAAVRLFLARNEGRSPSRKHVEAVERALFGRGEVRLSAGLSARVEGGALLVGPPRDERTRSGAGGNTTKAQDY